MEVETQMVDEPALLAHVLKCYLARYQAMDVSPSRAAELVKESGKLNDSVNAAAGKLSLDHDPHSYPVLLRQLNEKH